MESKETWELIRKQVNEELEKMERKRSAYVRRALICGGCMPWIISIYMWTTLDFERVFEAGLITGILLMASLITGLFLWGYSRLSKMYKKRIMPILVEAICPNATYDPNSGIEKETLFASNVFRKHDKEEFSHEDGIYGKVEQTGFMFCEAHLNYVQSVKVNGEKKTQAIKQFDGMAFEADFNTSLESVTMATTLETIEGTDSTTKRISIERDNFGQIFKVFSNNEADAKKIISEDVKNRLTGLYKIVKTTMGESDMTVSFYKNKMLILIPSSRNRFEARIFFRLREERVKEDFVVIKEMVNFVELLNSRLSTES